MASTFVGGFARALMGRMDARHQQEMELKKARALEELRREFEAEIIDHNATRIEGEFEIRYNKYGQEISRRRLSPEELEMRQEELKSKKASGRLAEAQAKVAESEAQFAPERIGLERDRLKADIEASRGNLGINRDRLSLDRRRYEDELSASEEKKIGEAEEILYAVGQDPRYRATGSSMVEVLRAELEAAIAKKDRRKINQLVNQIKGEFGIEYLRETSRARNEGRTPGLDGLSGMYVPVPGGD